MGESIEQAVRRVITTMRGNLGENLTVDDLARSALYSKFHFTRTFQQITGVPPARFLGALRLAEAKRLLLTTDVTVTQISHRVGYSSIGTFSSRFSSSVGLSPNAYRLRAGYAAHIQLDPRWQHGASSTAVVRGRIWSARTSGPVFVGLFRTPVPQASPVRCAVLPRPGGYQFRDVPQGAWHLLAQSVPAGAEHELGHPEGGERPPLVGSLGPIVVGPSQSVRAADLCLRPIQVIDPPVLLALLDVRSVALAAS